MNQLIYDICLQNNIPIYVFLILTGIIFGTVGILSDFINLKNTLVKTKFMIEYEQIKLKYPEDPTTQVEEVLEMYKQNGYKHGLSIFLRIVTIIINSFIFISLMSIWQSAEIDYSLLNCSFLWMHSIFDKISLVYLSIIITIMTLITDTIGKKLKDVKIKSLLPSLAISFLSMMLYGLLFSTTYLVFLIGMLIVKIIFAIFTIKTKKEIVQYAKENLDKLNSMGLKDTSSESKKQAFNILKTEVDNFIEGEKKAED